MGNLEFLSKMQRVIPQRVCTFSLFCHYFPQRKQSQMQLIYCLDFFRHRLRVSRVERQRALMMNSAQNPIQLWQSQFASQCSVLESLRAIVNDAEAKASKQKPESCAGRSEHGLEETISFLKVLLKLGYSTMEPVPRSSAGTTT